MDNGLSKMNDRDLLVMIYTKQENLENEFKEVKIALAGKADAKRLEQIEVDVKSLQKTQWKAAGYISAITSIATFVATHFWK